MKACEIGTTTLHNIIQRRLRQKSAAATINKELSWVRRAMKLGARHQPPLVLQAPEMFDLLPVDNARQGTIDHDQYRVIGDALPLYARIALVIGYHTGSRKGEITSILVNWVDLKAGRINSPGRVTKNGRTRYLPIYGEMRPELDKWLTRIAPSKCSFLIQDEGKRVFSLYKTWKAACKTTGVPETLFQDLRRTAVTNMIEAGLSEREAMEISGHKTRAVFDRYHIVRERRMKQNAEKLAEHLKAKDRASTVTDTPEVVQ